MTAATKLFPELNQTVVDQVLDAQAFNDENVSSVLRGAIVLSSNGFLYTNILKGTRISCHLHDHGFAFTICINFVSISYLERPKEFVFKQERPGPSPDTIVVITPVSQLDSKNVRISKSDELFTVDIEESSDPSEEPEELAFLDLVVKKGKLIWPKGEFKSTSWTETDIVTQVVSEYLQYRHTIDDQIKQLLQIQGQLIEKKNAVK